MAKVPLITWSPTYRCSECKQDFELLKDDLVNLDWHLKKLEPSYDHCHGPVMIEVYTSTMKCKICKKESPIAQEYHNYSCGCSFNEFIRDPKLAKEIFELPDFKGWGYEGGVPLPRGWQNCPRCGFGWWMP